MFDVVAGGGGDRGLGGGGGGCWRSVLLGEQDDHGVLEVQTNGIHGVDVLQLQAEG